MLKKTVKPLIGLGLILYFLLLVLSNAPAAWAAWAIHKAVPNVWFMGVSGTLWNGKANGSQIDIGDQAVPLGKLSWELNPLTLWILRPCLEVTTTYPGQTFEGEFCYQVGGALHVDNAEIAMPISVINPLIVPAQVTGRATVQIKEGEFSQSNNALRVNELEGRLTWENARASAIDGWVTLGAHAAQLKANGSGGIAADIFDVQGPYRVKLAGQWNAASGFSTKGTVKPEKGASEMAVQALQTVAEQNQDGSFNVQWPL